MHIKKINLLIFIILFGYTKFIFADGWEQAAVPTYPSQLNKVFFINTQTGWIVGEKGNIFKSIDGGNTWNLQISNTNQKLNTVFFIDELNGFAGGDNCKILYTKDGGNYWKVDSIPAPDKRASVRALFFSDSSNGWVLASTSSKGFILHTSDAGKTWAVNLSVNKELLDFSIRSSGIGAVCGKDFESFYYTSNGINWTNSTKPTGFDYNYIRKDVKSIQMVSDLVGYAVGYGAYVLAQPSILFKTTDGGVTWKNIKFSSEVEPYEFLYNLWFSDENNGYIVGGLSKGSVLLKTSDGGNSWVFMETPFGSSIKSICGAGNKAWAVGSEGIITFSEDRNIWKLVTPILSSKIGTIDFPTQSVGYAAGYSGALTKTTDGGKTWRSSYVSTNHKSFNVNDIHFINDEIGFAAHSYRMVSKTTDGGYTWGMIMKDTTAAICNNQALYFTDENHGIVVGSDSIYSGVIYRTTNGGVTWKAKRKATHGNLLSVNFRNSQNGICVGDDLNSLYTSDGGETWSFSSIGSDIPVEKITPSPPPIFDVTFINDNTAVAVGSGLILRSVDKGATWEYNPDSPEFDLYHVAFEDEKNGYAVGREEVLKTTDGGETWGSIIDTNIVNTGIYSLGVRKPGSIFIGSSNGTIYKYEKVVSYTDNNIKKDYRITLKQNYPNPFNPVTWIEYEIPANGDVKLTVYDILGRQLFVLVDGYYKSGIYKVNFNASSLASGIYYYTLKSGDQIISKKMQLLK